MKRLTLLTVCAVVGLICSCEKYVIPKSDIPTDVSYSSDVQPIFDDKCTSSNCHGGGRSPDLRPSNSYNSLTNGGYVNTDDPESSSLYIMMQDAHGTSTQDEAAMILGWITEGALNN